MESVTIDKKDINELASLVSELNDRVESLQLMSDKEFMESLKRSKEQIKKREFADWNDL